MKQIPECLFNQFSKSISFLLFMEGNFFRIMVVFEFKWNIQVYLEAGLTPRRMRNPYNNTKYQLYILHKKVGTFKHQSARWQILHLMLRNEKSRLVPCLYQLKIFFERQYEALCVLISLEFRTTWIPLYLWYVEQIRET